MKAAMIILTVTATTLTLMTAIYGRSSFYNIVKDHHLIGHVRERHAVSSFVSCAQLCLKNRPLCRSLNYGEEAGLKICELNDEAVQGAETGLNSLASKPEFIFAQLLDLETHSQSCEEIKRRDPLVKSGVYQIYPVPNANPSEVYCELDMEGGVFSFLSHSLTMRSDAQQIVDALFNDKNNVMLMLKKKVAGSESFTLIQPHPNYANVEFGVLVNSYSGYTPPKNDYMEKYIFLGVLPKLLAGNKTPQGFKSNDFLIEFTNCDAKPNSFFAFLPNLDHQTPAIYQKDSRWEQSGLAVEWRSTAKPISHLDQTMPNEFFFLTELHFGGCGCYSSSDRWRRFGYNATAIGIR